MKSCRTCVYSLPFEDCSNMNGWWKDYDLKNCSCELYMKIKNDIDKKRYCKNYKKEEEKIILKNKWRKFNEQ